MRTLFCQVRAAKKPARWVASCTESLKVSSLRSSLSRLLKSRWIATALRLAARAPNTTRAERAEHQGQSCSWITLLMLPRFTSLSCWGLLIRTRASAPAWHPRHSAVLSTGAVVPHSRHTLKCSSRMPAGDCASPRCQGSSSAVSGC